MVWGFVIQGLASYASARKSSKASKKAAGTQAGLQQQGLQYMMDVEAPQLYYRDQALAALANEYGLSPYQLETDQGAGVTIDAATGQPVEQLPATDDTAAQATRISAGQAFDRMAGRYGAARGMGRAQTARRVGESIQRTLANQPTYETNMPYQPGTAPVPTRSVSEMAMDSPLYAAIMSGREAGEQAIARTSAATGGLRSGQSIDDLTRYNTDLRNQAFLQSRADIMSGLGSMAGMTTMAPQIAAQYGNIGSSLAGGQVAAAQAQQQGYGALGQALGQGVESYYRQKQINQMGEGIV